MVKRVTLRTLWLSAYAGSNPVSRILTMNKEDYEILWCIEEGMNSPDAILVSIKSSKEKVKKIMEKLAKEKLITLNKKYDAYYKEDYWDSYITEEGKKFIANKEYWKWIPASFR